MLKRFLFLCLGVWLIAAGSLSAHAGPCGVQKAQAELAAKASAHDHCDMMGAPDEGKPDAPPEKAQAAQCCCPAVLSALPAPPLPQSAALAFAPPEDFPAEMRAPSRNLIPEPPPPKA